MKPAGLWFLLLLLGACLPGESESTVFAETTQLPLPAGSSPSCVAIADLNGDGKSDLVVANQGSHTVSVLLGDGRGGFAASPGSPVPAGNAPSRLALADFNQDGLLDLAVANHERPEVTVLLGDGLGGFAPASYTPLRVESVPHVHSVAAGDLNQDGRVDLVVDSWGNSRVRILLQDQHGFATPGLGLQVPEIPYYNLHLADVNGDGRVDLVTPARRHHGVTVLLGDGRGGFKQARGSPFPAGDAPFALALGDLNGDENPDLAIVNYSGSIADPSQDAITILLGNGAGQFHPAPGSPFRSGHAPTSVAVGDLNGDGLDDIAVGNLGSNNVAILLSGKDTIAPAPGSPFSSGRQPSALAIADLNGDGKADLVVANSGSDDLTVLWAR